MSSVGYFFDRIGKLIWAHGEFEGKLRRLVVNWNPSQLPLCDQLVSSHKTINSEELVSSSLQSNFPEGTNKYPSQKIEPSDAWNCNGDSSGQPISVSALHGDFRSFQELIIKGCAPLPHDVIYSDNPEELVGSFDLVVVGLSRCYEQNLLFFRLAAQVLCPGGIMCVAGPNSWGARRLEKEFSRHWDNVETVSKFHGRFFWSSIPKVDAKTIQVEWARGSSSRVLEPGGLITTPGNFSWKGYDSGSELLVHTLIKGGYLQCLRGSGADLGAGYGFLTKSILGVRDFEKIFLLESDRWALHNAERNISNPGVRFLWCDISTLGGYSNANVEGMERNLQWIIMNPPFHEISGEVSLELGLSFFRAAHSLLCSGGRLFWVANEHLPYLSEVKKKFRKVSVLGSDSHFLVGYAEK